MVVDYDERKENLTYNFKSNKSWNTEVLLVTKPIAQQIKKDGTQIHRPCLIPDHSLLLAYLLNFDQITRSWHSVLQRARYSECFA